MSDEAGPCPRTVLGPEGDDLIIVSDALHSLARYTECGDHEEDFRDDCESCVALAALSRLRAVLSRYEEAAKAARYDFLRYGTHTPSCDRRISKRRLCTCGYVDVLGAVAKLEHEAQDA